MTANAQKNAGLCVPYEFGICLYEFSVMALFFGIVQAESILVEQQARSTLERFCSHIYYQYGSRQHEGLEYDFAAYLTRFDIGPAGTEPIHLVC